VDEPERPRGARGRRWRLGLLVLIVSTPVAILLAEFGLRTVLFSANPSLRSLGSRVRSEQFYCDIRSDDDFWKLRYLFLAPGVEEPFYPYHPELGWVGMGIDVETLDHRDEKKVGERRPVLLFGDSFAHCVTDVGTCWQDLLERSELSEEYRLLNYGVRGYGFDQSVLLMERVLPRFEGQKPVVVMSVLVDDDLDRSALGLRDWPKPRFSLSANGGLELGGVVPKGVGGYVKEHPLRFHSYLWRYLLWNTSLLPSGIRAALRGERERDAATRELNRRLVERAVRHLELRGVEYFFLLFHSMASAPSPERAWQEPFMLEELQNLGAPILWTRPLLSAAALASDCGPGCYYIPTGADSDHLNAAGNRVAFEAIERGLAGFHDDPAALRAACVDHLDLRGAETRIRFDRAGFGTDARKTEDRLLMRLGFSGKGSATYLLGGRADRFTARLSLLRIPGRGEGPIRALLEIGGDDRELLSQPIEEGVELEVDVDLSGFDKLHVVASNSQTSLPVVVVLNAPRIE
jgi:hypothetical protein